MNIRQWLLMSWVWLATGVMAGLVILTFPAKSVIASPLSPSTASVGKPGCQWGIINDVNNCGSWTVVSCTLLSTAPGGPGTPEGQQCEICRIWQFQIQGLQKVEKRWYDCNGDGHADCEIWWGGAQLKGCRTGSSSTSLNPLAYEDLECAC